MPTSLRKNGKPKKIAEAIFGTSKSSGKRTAKKKKQNKRLIFEETQRAR
jgi:hypothetical protein